MKVSVIKRAHFNVFFTTQIFWVLRSFCLDPFVLFIDLRFGWSPKMSLVWCTEWVGMVWSVCLWMFAPLVLGCVFFSRLLLCCLFWSGNFVAWCFVLCVAALLEETSGLLMSDAVSRSSSPTAIKQQQAQQHSQPPNTAHHHPPSLLNTVALLKAKGGVTGGKPLNAVVRRTSSYSPGT